MTIFILWFIQSALYIALTCVGIAFVMVVWRRVRKKNDPYRSVDRRV